MFNKSLGPLFLNVETCCHVLYSRVLPMLQCYAFNKAGSCLRTTCNHVYFLCWRQHCKKAAICLLWTFGCRETLHPTKMCVGVNGPVYSGSTRRVHIHLLCNVILLFVSIPHSGADKPLQAMVWYLQVVYYGRASWFWDMSVSSQCCLPFRLVSWYL